MNSPTIHSAGNEVDCEYHYLTGVGADGLAGTVFGYRRRRNEVQIWREVILKAYLG